jgi:hypothetical protein
MGGSLNATGEASTSLFGTTSVEEVIAADRENRLTTPTAESLTNAQGAYTRTAVGSRLLAQGNTAAGTKALKRGSGDGGGG